MKLIVIFLYFKNESRNFIHRICIMLSMFIQLQNYFFVFISLFFYKLKTIIYLLINVLLSFFFWGGGRGLKFKITFCIKKKQERKKETEREVSTIFLKTRNLCENIIRKNLCENMWNLRGSLCILTIFHYLIYQLAI